MSPSSAALAVWPQGQGWLQSLSCVEGNVCPQGQRLEVPSKRPRCGSHRKGEETRRTGGRRGLEWFLRMLLERLRERGMVVLIWGRGPQRSTLRLPYLLPLGPQLQSTCRRPVGEGDHHTKWNRLMSLSPPTTCQVPSLSCIDQLSPPCKPHTGNPSAQMGKLRLRREASLPSHAASPLQCSPVANGPGCSGLRGFLEHGGRGRGEVQC